jgi:hypothetical protein
MCHASHVDVRPWVIRRSNAGPRSMVLAVCMGACRQQHHLRPTLVIRKTPGDLSGTLWHPVIIHFLIRALPVVSSSSLLRSSSISDRMHRSAHRLKAGSLEYSCPSIIAHMARFLFKYSIFLLYCGGQQGKPNKPSITVLLNLPLEEVNPFRNRVIWQQVTQLCIVSC